MLTGKGNITSRESRIIPFGDGMTVVWGRRVTNSLPSETILETPSVDVSRESMPERFLLIVFDTSVYDDGVVSRKGPLDFYPPHIT
jgi:hypothetical protein